MEIQNKRILITGASGFIGSHLLDALARLNPEIHIISRSKLDFQNATVHHANIFETEKVLSIIKNVEPDVVFHLVGTVDKTLSENDIISINYESSIKVIDALSNSNGRFIFNSTADLYQGFAPPFNERMNLAPEGVYAKAKLAVENYCRKAYEEQGTQTVCLRPFIAYGPRQRGAMFIPQIMQACAQKKDFEMTLGEQTRDFVYISDVVDALLLAATKKEAAGQNINIASGEGTTLKDVSTAINKLFGFPIKLKFGVVPYRKNEIMQYYGDNSKAKEILGWTPKVALDAGLRETVDWWIKTTKPGH